MRHLVPSLATRLLALLCGLGLFGGSTMVPAAAEALLLVEAESGKVLHAENAAHPWYPASITKIMTTYVTLQAVKEGRIKLDTLIRVSENAAAQQPSKMGFPVGTQVTVDNALKMLMVRSANDMAVVLAEGVSGSVEAFAEEMNRTSARLGMTQSSWVNPNGLPNDMQVTSARDMAILARAMLREFPQHSIYWRAPAIRFGKRILRNYNKLIDRYPGADGMKTGFICASGYNLVATATRNGRQLIAIVLGSSSGTQRAETAASLLEKGFNAGAFSWFVSALGGVEGLQPIVAPPPNLREEICGKGRKNRTDHAEEEVAQAGRDGSPPPAFAAASLFSAPKPAGEHGSLLGPLTESMAPIPVSVVSASGAPINPDTMPVRSRKRRGAVVAAGKGKGKGRKSVVIDVNTDAKSGAGKATPKTKPAKAKSKAAKGKPAQGAAAESSKATAAVSR